MRPFVERATMAIHAPDADSQRSVAEGRPICPNVRIAASLSYTRTWPPTAGAQCTRPCAVVGDAGTDCETGEAYRSVVFAPIAAVWGLMFTSCFRGEIERYRTRSADQLDTGQQHAAGNARDRAR